MQYTLKQKLAYELLNSQVLLNAEGVGGHQSLLWPYTTLFPEIAFNELSTQYEMVPQGLWKPAPAVLSDGSDLTGFSRTFTAVESVWYDLIYRSRYNDAPRTIDRIYLQHASTAAVSNVYVYVSLDADDWTLVWSGDFTDVGEFVLLQSYQCNFVKFSYQIGANVITPFGTFTIFRAEPRNGAAAFDTGGVEVGAGLRGGVLVLDGKAGGMVDTGGAEFPFTYPFKDAMNIFTRPYSQDNEDARPAIYFGAFDLESNDRLEFQTVSSQGLVQWRQLNVPLVITAYGPDYNSAEFRRDLIRAKVRRILQNVPYNGEWWLLEISGDKNDSVETCVATGSGGANGTGMWEAVCVIPVLIHYKLVSNGVLLP